MSSEVNNTQNKKGKKMGQSNTLSQHCYKEKTKLLDNSESFLQIFHRNLADFWCKITGFNVIAFDAFISPNINENTYNAVLRKYGQEGVDLVKKLI